MVDFKTEIAARIIVALVLAILIYSFLSPVITLTATLTSFSCTSGSGVFCPIVYILITVFISIFALFICIWSLIEVFYK